MRLPSIRVFILFVLSFTICLDSFANGETTDGSSSSSATIAGNPVQSVTLPDGSRYEGNMINGLRSGKGICTWPNGERYEGDWINDQRTGKGIYIWANGNHYEGEFVEGKFSNGIVRDKTNVVLVTYVNGSATESQKAVEPDSSKMLIQQHQIIKGIQTYSNGRYEGDLVDNKKNGKGIFTSLNGDRYEGDWINDQQTGKGTYTWANGERYEGDWLNGQQSGKGLKIWPNGTRYEGDWVGNIESGKGALTLPDGKRYVGDFVNGIFSVGVELNNNGAIVSTYVNGKKQ